MNTVIEFKNASHSSDIALYTRFTENGIIFVLTYLKCNRVEFTYYYRREMRIGKELMIGNIGNLNTS